LVSQFLQRLLWIDSRHDYLGAEKGKSEAEFSALRKSDRWGYFSVSTVAFEVKLRGQTDAI